MKSDREFLKGIYEKAKTMQDDRQEKEFRSKAALKRTAYLGLGTAAAILIVTVSAGVFMQGWREEATKDQLHTPGVTSFRSEIPGGTQQLLNDATDIVVLEAMQGEENTPKIHEIYKSSVDPATIFKALAQNMISPDPEQRILVLLKITADSSEVLDILLENEVEDTYTNPLSGTITKEELEDSSKNQAIK
jgi:hypothetical protein